jgi:hypothetical protein
MNPNPMAQKQLLDFQMKQKRSIARLKLSVFLNILLLFALFGTYVFWLRDGWPFTMNLAMKSLNMPCKLKHTDSSHSGYLSLTDEISTITGPIQISFSLRQNQRYYLERK